MCETPTTLIEAVRYFSDLAVCEDYMRSLRWPDGKITCPELCPGGLANVAPAPFRRSSDVSG